jgi:cardiolipin synthase
MSAEVSTHTCNWLSTGGQVFPEMLSAIDAARGAVLVESYIFSPDSVGTRFRDALTRARQRGVRVQVLIDGLGSIGLPSAFWRPLTEAGGEVRVFNPLSLNRLGIRNHRKLLVCDERVAFIGGFNIAAEYEGDGVTCGWCDVGLKLEGPLVPELVESFEEMFSRADFKHKRFMRFRKNSARRTIAAEHEQLLLSGPGRGRSPIKQALLRDLATARSVQIEVAYFLPTWRIRHLLARVVAAGGNVELILAGKSDVQLALLAARSLYRRLLRAGISIFEYQPQILHSKLLVIDDIVYVGSCNLDQRSLHINYELMARFRSRTIAAQAQAIFEANKKHCRKVSLEEWRQARTLWRSMKRRWAYFVLVHVDPYIARKQWMALPD